eukprot:NODE_934_length_551_cov_231.450472_g924_i0.p1 GENE.NODE_934_length_551_cov_231.450472_g924_i0~~NODE_934_length_551_cov_231.450472_g924_i0.p1  ORF type:complete len:108 (+),score=13.85 NODE_934_length_551_cov_231.450472_g924_i0:111-434(+)
MSEMCNYCLQKCGKARLGKSAQKVTEQQEKNFQTKVVLCDCSLTHHCLQGRSMNNVGPARTRARKSPTWAPHSQNTLVICTMVVLETFAEILYLGLHPSDFPHPTFI